MALQVTEGAVVGDDLEAVRQRLEAAARTVTAVLARADELAHELDALCGVELRNGAERLFVPDARRLVEERRDQLHLGAVCTDQAHRGRRRARGRIQAEPPRDGVGG